MKNALAIILLGSAAFAAGAYVGEAGEATALTPDKLTWQANAEVPGVSTALTSGDIMKGPHSAFHQFKAGFSAPLHTHTATTRIVVLKGTMAVAGEDGKETQFPVGSYFTQPAGWKHVTKCTAATDCLVHLDADAAWDLKPVEATK